jgi:RNA polymerase sigma-70 factor (ECF subfamily)
MMEAMDSQALGLARSRHGADVSRPGAASRATDAAAIEALFQAHQGALGRFLAQMVGDRWLADELLQETFLTAVRERQRLDSVARPEAWLFAIARNRALHALRSRARAARALTRLLRERPRSEPDPAEAVAVRDFLRRHLTPHDRALLVLRYVHGFQSRELAGMVGRTPEAIRQELSRARRTLLEKLDEERAQSATEPKTQRRQGS